MKTKMHILVTNDDGVTAPGILALAHEMDKLGKVSILAPDRNWSASGHVRTIDRPLRVRSVSLADGTQAYACDGAPSDCVALAACNFLGEKVDLVMSGINPTANVGHDVTYSGTVTAAMEAAIWGIPAIAVSVDSTDNLGALDYTTPASVAYKVANAAIHFGIRVNTFLNVNVPYLPKGKPRGMQITRQGLRVYHDRLDRREDPRGKPYYWTIGDLPTGIPEPGSDIGALAEGYVSITPLHLDLTAYRSIPEMNMWDWKPENQPTILSEVSLFLP